MAIKVKSNTDEFKKRLKLGAEKAQREISIVTTAELKSNSPVVTSQMKKSITSDVENKNNKFKTVIGVPDSIKYGAKVELTSKKNKGWFRRTFSRIDFKEIIVKNMQKVLK